MNVLATLHTTGDGCWSGANKAVEIVDISIGYMSSNQDWGEMRVYFNDTWDVCEDGLIYTDSQFEYELRKLLQTAGFTKAESNDVFYSEQGMQGEDYVSLDMDKKACAAWKRLFPQEFMLYVLSN